MLSAQKNRPAVHRQPAGFSFFLRAYQQKCKSMLVVREACKLQFSLARLAICLRVPAVLAAALAWSAHPQLELQPNQWWITSDCSSQREVGHHRWVVICVLGLTPLELPFCQMWQPVLIESQKVPNQQIRFSAKEGWGQKYFRNWQSTPDGTQ